MIDTKTGTVLLDDIQSITPSLTLDVFLASPLGHGAQSFGVAADWPLFYVGKHEIFGDACTVILMFHKQQLIGVRVHVLDPSLVDPKPDFNDYDEGEALALKVRFEAWLAAKLGPPPYLYPWGRIDAVYSPQDVSTGIFVAYPSPPRGAHGHDRASN
jgi:hypothetical protein